MQATKDELEQIMRMAAAAYTPGQVAFAMGFDKEEFNIAMTDENNPVSIAFFKGLYSAELAVRESIVTLARNGSSPAQTLVVKLFDQTRKTLLINNGYNEGEI